MLISSSLLHHFIIIIISSFHSQPGEKEVGSDKRKRLEPHRLGCTGFPPRLLRSGWLDLARFARSDAKIERGLCYRLSSHGARQSRLECTRLLHLPFNARGLLAKRASRARSLRATFSKKSQKNVIFLLKKTTQPRKN